jgi:hypothetical protein
MDRDSKLGSPKLKQFYPKAVIMWLVPAKLGHKRVLRLRKQKKDTVRRYVMVCIPAYYSGRSCFEPRLGDWARWLVSHDIRQYPQGEAKTNSSSTYQP